MISFFSSTRKGACNMAQSAKQNVMSKINKFGGFIEVTRTDEKFIVEAIAPYGKYWKGNGRHSIIASVDKGTYTMDAWQQVHSIIKFGVDRCQNHCDECKECEETTIC
jgi:hypothetical protein